MTDQIPNYEGSLKDSESMSVFSNSIFSIYSYFTITSAVTTFQDLSNISHIYMSNIK